MTTGPTEVSYEVLSAGNRRVLLPHLEEFNEGTLVHTLTMLQEILRTTYEVILFPGSGRIALESGVASVLEPGDKALAIVPGLFGEWMVEILARAGVKTTVLRVAEGQPLDLAKVEEALTASDYKAVTMVHHETSTGAAYPLEELGQLVQSAGALFLVDAVSSVGGMPLETDAWHIDISMSTSHKAIGSLVGIGFASVSPRAWFAMESRKQKSSSYSYDLLRWKEMWIPIERGGSLVFGWRRPPITLPTHSIYALETACEQVLSEGLSRRIERHRIAAKALREGVSALGCQLFAHPEVASNTVTSVTVPPGVEAGAILEGMERLGIAVSPGLDSFSSKMFRVGHMNLTATWPCVISGLAALGSVLGALDFRCDRNAALEAAFSVFEAEGWPVVEQCSAQGGG